MGEKWGENMSIITPIMQALTGLDFGTGTEGIVEK